LDEDLMRGYFYELAAIQGKAMMDAISVFPIDGTIGGLIKSAEAWKKNVTILEGQFMKKNSLTLQDIARIKVMGELLGWSAPDNGIYEIRPVSDNSFAG